MGFSRSINPRSGSVGAKTASVQAGQSGSIFQLRAPLKAPVVWSKVSGHANLSVAGSAIAVAAALAAGASQSIVVRGANGSSAVEFQVTVAGPPVSISRAVIISPVGDSNGDGYASDESSLVWTADENIVTLNAGGQFVTYQPGVITGASDGADNAHIGPEAEFARLIRAASPDTKVFIVKSALAGSTQNAGSGPANWTSGSSLMVAAKSRLDQAKTLVAATALTLDHIYVCASLGINDANSTYRLQYSAAAAAMYADIKANWLRDARDMILQLRVTNNNSSTPTIRAAQQANTKDVAQVKLIDTDGFGKNADVTHYNLAGQIAQGAACFNVATGVAAGLNLDLFPTETFADNSRGWIPAAGWAVSGGNLNANAGAAFSTAGITAIIDRPSATYRFTYDLVVSAGSARIQVIGGSTVSGVTRTASGSYSEDIIAPATANAGDIRINFAAAGSGFTGSIDNVKIQRL